MSGKRKIIPAGSKFGKLMVICAAKVDKWGKSKSWVICSCGKSRTLIASNNSLKSGRKQSCNCMRGKKLSHGMSKTTEYEVWLGIKKRCYNKKCKRYKNYGGRGIIVCSEWLNSFETFFKDMGKRPENKSLDREDNNGDYCKENCRWASNKEQARNTTTNCTVIYKGKPITLAEASEKSGINYSTLRARNRKGDKGKKLFRKV